MDSAVARLRFSLARVARLATADTDGRPHLVPIVFVVHGSVIYSAVDAKPKRTTALRRLANIDTNPKVAALVDDYHDDWSRLWWARADGIGRVLAVGTHESDRAIDLLAGRYQQYREERPVGPVLAIDVERWSGWSAR